MSNDIQCYDEYGMPKCYYYSIVRYGKFCSFDGTCNPCERDCPHFIPLGDYYIDKLDPYLDRLDSQKSCHNCIWRNYSGNLMVCDNPVAKRKIRTDQKFITPCEEFDLDETGQEYIIRITEGYDTVKAWRLIDKAERI